MRRPVTEKYSTSILAELIMYPKPSFEELEDEGILVPEEACYFPYRATFDFECYFDKEKGQELKNTEKLN